MTFTTIREHDENEPRPLAAAPDGISIALGSGVYVRSHRFPGLHFVTPIGRSSLLPVSRFYYGLRPQVVVDFRREILYRQMEVDAKTEYFAQRDIRYLLANDEWDTDAALAAEPVAQDDVRGAARSLVTAPRRKPC